MIVVGGGLAGVAAAVFLAERGVRTTLVEREPFLGGRVAAWTDHLAADHLLARWGVEGETIWTVPRRGLLARG